MFCWKCWEKINKNVKFCPKCGANIIWDKNIENNLEKKIIDNNYVTREEAQEMANKAEEKASNNWWWFFILILVWGIIWGFIVFNDEHKICTYGLFKWNICWKWEKVSNPSWYYYK